MKNVDAGSVPCLDRVVLKERTSSIEPLFRLMIRLMFRLMATKIVGNRFPLAHRLLKGDSCLTVDEDGCLQNVPCLLPLTFVYLHTIILTFRTTTLYMTLQ